MIQATWDEVEFENALWTVPKSWMKAGKPHTIYLSQEILDIMVALRTCAGGSRYLSPSRYDGEKCMSNATLNRVTYLLANGRRLTASNWILLPSTTCGGPVRPS